MPSPRPALIIRLTHTGYYADGRTNVSPVQVTDLDVGYENQNRKVPVYVPPNGHIDINASSRSMLSYEQGGIAKFTNVGVLRSQMFYVPESYTTGTLPPATGYPAGVFVWNTTDTQAYWSDGTNWVAGSSPTGAAGGDLGGTYPNPTVVGIQGFPIENGVGPNNGDALLYNSLTGQWEHSPIIFGGGPPVGPAGGDLGGLYPNPGVTGLQLDPLPVKTADGFLKRNAANTAWEEVGYGSGANTVTQGNDPRLSDSRTPTGAAGGDLTGTYPNPTLVAVGTAGVKGSASSVPVFTTDSKGRVTSSTDTAIQIAESQVTGLVTDLGNKADKVRSVLAGAGLTGGGDLSADRTISMPNVGTAGTYGGATTVPVLTTDAQGRVSSVTPTAIAFPAFPSALSPALGNVLLVDQVNGNDLTGTVNGPPFKTIEAALAHIVTNLLTGVTVWVMPGTYTLASATVGLTIPNTCAIRGLNTQTVRVVMNGSNPGGTVTMLTMGENTRVEDMTLTLNSSNATTNLVGIHLPGTTSVTSKLRTTVVTVDNSGVPVGSTTNVYGVLSDGTGALNAGTFSFNTLKGSTLNVYSNGAGNKFGIYQPSGNANQLSTRDFNLYVRAPIDPTSLGLYVGIYTDNDNSQVQTRSTTIGGSPYPAVALKLPVAVVATTNITLTGTYTLQGVALTVGTRVLAAGQTVGANNGIWIVQSGAWTRAIDMAAGSPALGAYIYCNDGTYEHTGWECTTNLNVGAGALTFVQRYAGADIHQNAPQAGSGTNGIQLGPGTDIVTKTAGTHPFTTYVTPTTIQFCVRGNIQSGTSYLWPGTLVNTSDPLEVFYRFQQKSVMQGMFVNLRTAPGVGKELTVTINKSTTGVGGSGAATLLKATISGTNTSATCYTASVDFGQFDFLSVQVDCSNGSSAADLVVELDLF